MSDARDALSIDGLLIHRRFVRALARALVRDEAAADDLEQETWLRACQSPPTVDRGLRGWLKRVVRNAAGDARRSDERRGDRDRRSAQPEQEPSTDAIAARLEIEKKLVAAVESLDERYRRVVFLRFFEELPPRTVAKRLQLPVDTVRTQTARALEQLRKKLDDAHGGARSDWIAAMAPIALAPVSVAPLVSWAAAAVLLVGLSMAVLPPRFFARHQAPDEARVAQAAAPAVLPSAPGAATEPTRATESDRSEGPGLIHGCVVGPLRTPLSNAAVSLQREGEPTRTHSVDAEGRFRFETLPLGRYLVVASATHYTATRSWIDLRDSAGAAEVRLTLADARDVHGVVVDGGGAAVKGALVDATYYDRDHAWPERSVTTADDGTFALLDVPLHPFTLAVFAPGHLPSWSTSVPRGDAAIRIVLRDDPVCTLDFDLDPAAIHLDADAPIQLLLTPMVDGRTVYAQRRSATTTAGAKLHSVSDLATGTYDVAATTKSARLHVEPQRSTLTSGSTSHARIVVDAIRTPVTIRGRVVDPAGAPVAMARFWIGTHFRADDSTAVACDAAGGFAFQSPVGSGETFQAWPDDARGSFARDDEVWKSTRVKADGAGPLTLRLRGTERISGRVVMAGVRPLGVESIAVCTSEPRLSALDQVRPCADGSFVLTGQFAHRPLSFELHGEFGSVVVPIDFTLPNGATRDDVVVPLPAFCTIRGVVVDEDGIPVAGAILRTTRHAAPALVASEWKVGAAAKAVADREGRFVLDFVPPDTARVFIAADPDSDSGVVDVAVALTAGEVREDVRWTLPLRRAAPGTFRVRVVWDDGAPAAGASVEDLAHDGRGSSGVDESGRVTGGPTAHETARVIATFDHASAEGKTIVRSKATTVTVGGPEVEIVLPRPRYGRARGRIPDDIAPEDLAGLRVRAQFRPEFGDEGYWSVDVPTVIAGQTIEIGPLSAGTYRELGFDAPNAKRLEVNVTIPVDGVADLGELQFELVPPTRVTVVDGNGQPIPTAEFLEQGKWALLGTEISNATQTLAADGRGLIEIPGNVYRGVIRAPGFAWLDWERGSDEATTLTLLRAGALAVRDLPIEARDSQFIWWFEIEVRSIGTARGSHPATIQGGGTNGWVNGQKLEHLPAGPVTLHFWKERTDGEMRHPAVPASGSYYRVDATVVAGQVTDVSIAPGH